MPSGPEPYLLFYEYPDRCIRICRLQDLNVCQCQGLHYSSHNSRYTINASANDGHFGTTGQALWLETYLLQYLYGFLGITVKNRIDNSRGVTLIKSTLIEFSAMVLNTFSCNRSAPPPGTSTVICVTLLT